MNAIDAIRTCLANYATFRGRASRPEFWWFQLFCTVILIGASVADDALLGPGSDVGVFALIASLALLLPQLAAGARRLHDSGRTGWWLLIGIVPLVGDLVLIVLFCLRGTLGANDYGDPPGLADDGLGREDWERLEQRRRG